MTIREVIGYAKNWIKGKLIHDTVLDEYFEEWCSEHGYDSVDNDNRYDYIDELQESLFRMFELHEGYSPQGSSLSEGYQVDYDEFMDGIMEMSEDEEWTNDDMFNIAKQFSWKLSRPFDWSYGYEYMPIMEAIRNTFGDDPSELGDVEATVGQKIMLGFLMQGTDGRLDPIYLYHSMFNGVY